MLVTTFSDVNRVLKRLRKVMLIFQKPKKNTYLDPTLSNNMSHFTEQHSPVEHNATFAISQTKHMDIN